MQSMDVPADTKPGARDEARERRRLRMEFTPLLNKFLVDEGALAAVSTSGWDNGIILVSGGGSRKAGESVGVPSLAMSAEHYNAVMRALDRKQPVRLRVNVDAHFTSDSDQPAYNTIAEIPGSDKKDEVVMLGGHLDSWHSATGATDNAIGCSIMMEAARILLKLGVQPRRTIRVALWSGEEEGILGSQAYVKEHFGSFEAQKPEYSKLVGYLNIDTGTGQLRGASVFGPAPAAATVREILAPFQDLGIYGAATSSSRVVGGTDSTAFSNAGLPGIGFQQDPIEYNTHTHHTNLDTYERVIEEDVKKAAVIVASTIYHLAMRDEMLARFAPADMPPPPPPRAAGQ